MKNPENGCVLRTVRDAEYNPVSVVAYFLEGREVTEEEYRKVYPLDPGVPMISAGWSRPMLSDALAVHPSQVQEATARNAKRGCSVTYRTDDGRAIVPDRGERKKLLKIEGFHDRDGGYGDG